MVDFLFLDFDGVLHPPYDGLPTPKEVCFCHLPRFEAVMRQHPGVHIVISSTWRQQFGLAQLRGYFCADIAQRIVGITSSYPADGALRLHVREWEILQWLQTHKASHRPWLALDDSQGDFLDCRHRVVFCHPWEGLTEHRARRISSSSGNKQSKDRKRMSCKARSSSPKLCNLSVRRFSA